MHFCFIKLTIGQLVDNLTTCIICYLRSNESLKWNEHMNWLWDGQNINNQYFFLKKEQNNWIFMLFEENVEF